MDRDMHYYGTYVAANLAGYTEWEAMKIAYAAQYVDDCTLYQMNKLYGNIVFNKEDFERRLHAKMIITCQNLTDFTFERVISSYNDNDNAYRQIWSIFHFLPGNLKNELTYNGEYEHLIYSYDSKAKWEFSLICRTCSELLGKVINNVKNYKYDKTILIGIVMHVLADTWSHYDFSGSPCWWINEVTDSVLYKDQQWFPIDWVSFEVNSPSSPFINSVSYLGHGRIGHIADLPWINYKCKNQWRGYYIEKDNKEDFCKGFVQMIVALKSIKNGLEFSVSDFNNGVNIETINQIKSIIDTKQELSFWSENRVVSRCKLWKDYIMQNFNKTGIFVDYSVDKWYLGGEDLTGFHLAADFHQKFVNETMTNAGTSLYWLGRPDECRLSIIAATYGNKDITEEVKNFVGKNIYSIKINNDTFSDPMPEKQKHFSVIYDYQNKINICTGDDNTTIDLKSVNGSSLCQLNQDYQFQLDFIEINIMYAAYGYGVKVIDVTKTVFRTLMNSRKTSFKIDNDTFGEPCQGHNKFFAIVYLWKGIKYCKLGFENETIDIQDVIYNGGAASLKDVRAIKLRNREDTILYTAVYGSHMGAKSVLSEVNNLSNTEFKINNTNFTDPSKGYNKCLFMKLSYPNKSIRYFFCQEGYNLDLSELSLDNFPIYNSPLNRTKVEL